MAARPKLLNDPVYGFIQVRHADFTDIFDHPWVQRLRRISQLGLSHLVYPGAVHNRFHHALGAMFLMQEALDSLREKGVVITDCLLYTSPSPRDATLSRMPSSA